MVIETRWWFVVTVCGVAACGAKISTDPGTGVTLSVVRRGNSTFVGVVTLRSTAEGRVYSASVEPGSSVSLDLPPGVDTVSVTGIPDYCWPDQDEISVTVTEGTPTQATFELTCIGDFAYSIVDQMAYLGTDGKLTQHTYPGAVDFLSWSPDGTSVLGP
jgi:hypothetical protein